LQAEEEAKDRAISWLQLQGYSKELVEQMLRLFREAGYKPGTWLDRLGDMPGQELMQLVSDAEQAQAKEDELAGYMQEACDQLLRADYLGAMRKYNDVLEVDADNEEATRGRQEAEKGHKLISLTPEQLEQSMKAGSLEKMLGVQEGLEASATAKKFDPTKKLPKREPHFPETPYDLGSKGPTHITVCWHQHKNDIAAPELPLPMEHQVQYGRSRKLNAPWLDAPWNGDTEGQLVPVAHSGGKAKIGIVQRPGRKWTCRIEGLSPGDKYVVRVRMKNARGWGKWSWTSKPMVTTLD